MRTIFRTFIMVATMLAIVCPMSAWTLQKGVVQEYRGKNKKTPLSNVELKVKHASSTVSDKKGRYELQFRTLKPGNKVNVHRIEKLGYEIFNKEALEQWYISSQNESFTIVMVKSKNMKKLRDEYSIASSKSYKRQYENDKAKLEEERKQNKLTQQEYENKIKALEEEYDYQLTQLDNYVDRFSRIDLSELSQEEQEIIELVRQGEIDEAINRYNALGVVSKLHETANQMAEIDGAIKKMEAESNRAKEELDRLFVTTKNMLDTYRLRGGQDSYTKIVEICNNVARNSNIPCEYKIILECYLKYKDAIKFYECIDFEEIKDKHMYLIARESYGIALQFCGQLEKALEQFQIEFVKANEWGYQDLVIDAELGIASVYSDQMKMEEVWKIYLKYEDLLEDDADHAIDEITKNKISISLTDYYQQVGNYDKMLQYGKLSYDLATSIYQNKPIDRYLAMVVNTASIYVIALRTNNKLEEAYALLTQTLPVSEKYYLQNRQHNHAYYISDLQTFGDVCFGLQKYDESEQAYIKSISIIKEAKDFNADAVLLSAYAISIFNNLGYLYFTVGDKEKSEQAYLQCIEVCNKRVELSDVNFLIVDAIFRPRVNISTLYNSMENYEKTKQYGAEAYKYCELLYSNFPDAYVNEYVLILKELTIADMNLGLSDSALEYIDKAIQSSHVNSFDTSSFLTTNIAQLYDIKGQILLNKGDKEGALDLIKKIKEVDANYQSKLSELLAE